MEDLDEVRAVVVTHEHIDHAGLAARWAGQGAAIVAMPEALPMLAAGYPATALDALMPWNQARKVA